MTIETKIATNNSTVDTANNTGNITGNSDNELTDREKFLAAKEEIKTTAGRYLGDGNFAQAWQRKTGFGWRNTSKKNAALILAGYSLTVEEYLAAQKQWIDEEVARGAAECAIYYQAQFLRDKINRDCKPVDDNSEVFDLLPSVDELNDVDLTKSAYFDGRADLGYIFKLSVAINHSFDGTRPWTLESIDGNITVEGRTWQDYAKFIITDTDGSEEDNFADEMPALFPAEDGDDDELIDPPSERYDGYIGEDQVSYWHGKLIYITSSKYGASMNLHPEAIKILGKYLVQIPDGKWRKFVRPDENTFWQMMIERGACTINNELPQNVNRTKTITPDEMLAIVDTLDTVNASAPAGWQIDYNGKNFPVKFNGKTVATLDSLALAKVLPPDKFFDRFNPDVPPKEQYINDRRKELDQLLDMRKFVEDDPDRLKTLANLIEDVKREILDSKLDTEHLPDCTE